MKGRGQAIIHVCTCYYSILGVRLTEVLGLRAQRRTSALISGHT